MHGPPPSMTSRVVKMTSRLISFVDTDPELFDVTHLPPSVLAAIEADTFWCLSKLLDGIQDNYISHQPGIQRLVKRMGELVKRIDGKFHLIAHSDFKRNWTRKATNVYEQLLWLHISKIKEWSSCNSHFGG